jgi:hypothetical protein
VWFGSHQLRKRSPTVRLVVRRWLYHGFCVGQRNWGHWHSFRQFTLCDLALADGIVDYGAMTSAYGAGYNNQHSRSLVFSWEILM